MDIDEFNRKRNERFILLYGFYTILFCVFVLQINVDFILYYIITAIIATFLAIFTIIFRIETKIDNFFFKIRKNLDKNIYNLIKIIWEKNIKEKNCEEPCKYLEKKRCTYNFDITNPEIQNICLYKIFFPIINSDKKFKPSKSFIFQENLNYYICIVSLLLSVISLFFLNGILLFKIFLGDIQGNMEVFIKILILQIVFFFFFLTSQAIRNKFKSNHKIKDCFLKNTTLIFFINFLILSIITIFIVLLDNIGIYSNNIIGYLIILMILLISALFGKNSKRIKNYIEINQRLQFDMILDLEFEEKKVSEKLKKAICDQTKREIFLMPD